MWIIPKNLYGICPSVQDTEESTLDSDEFCQSAEQSLMWRSKPSLSKTWLTRLKRNNWIQHLYTRTLSHSHSKSFVDAWTSYQDGESVLQYVLRSLEEVGYSATAGVFSASEIGAPHQRKRVFILGYSTLADSNNNRYGQNTTRQEKKG